MHHDELGSTLGEALLTPTKIYVKPVLALLEEVDVKGVTHITGGGFYENIPRCLDRGCVARIEKKSAAALPPIFHLHPEGWEHPRAGHVQHLQHGRGHDVRRARRRGRDKALAHPRKPNGEDAYVMGEIVAGRTGWSYAERSRCWCPAAAPTCRPCSTARPRGENPQRRRSACVVASKPGVYALDAGRQRTACPRVVVRRKDYAAARGL